MQLRKDGQPAPNVELGDTGQKAYIEVLSILLYLPQLDAFSVETIEHAVGAWKDMGRKTVGNDLDNAWIVPWPHQWAPPSCLPKVQDS